MANSRLEKIGTIFSRVHGLIKSGAMRFEERPIWYDIYEKYPPFVEPKVDQKIENIKIRDIFYAEDLERAKPDETKFYNLFEGRKKFEPRREDKPQVTEKKKLIDAKELLDLKD